MRAEDRREERIRWRPDVGVLYDLRLRARAGRPARSVLPSTNRPNASCSTDFFF
jgi:hypothetical protein